MQGIEGGTGLCPYCHAGEKGWGEGAEEVVVGGYTSGVSKSHLKTAAAETAKMGGSMGRMM
jgi:hypothetical protein